MCGGQDTPSQSAEEKELAAIAVEKWNSNSKMYFDVQNDYIEAVQTGEADYADAAGRTNTANNMAFGEVREDLSQNLFAQNFSADSGRFMGAMTGLSEDQGLTLGTGLNETRMAVENSGLGGLQSVVDMGLGQEAQAFQGMTDIAGQATRDSITRAGRAYDERMGKQHLVGTVLGAGASAYQNGMFSGGPSAGTAGSTTRADYNLSTGRGGQAPIGMDPAIYG